MIEPDDLTTLPTRLPIRLTISQDRSGLPLTIPQVAACVSDPAERLRMLRAFERRLSADADEARAEILDAYRVAIGELRSRSPRPTWREIGDLLGVTASRAEQLSKPDPKEAPRGCHQDPADDDPAPALPGMELPEYHGRPADGMKSSITGAGNRVSTPHEIGQRLVLVVEVEVVGSGHKSIAKKLTYVEALSVVDLFEVTDAKAAARLLSAMRETYRTAEDNRLGRTPLAPGMGEEVHTDESGNILGPPDLAAVRGDPVAAMLDERVSPAVVVYSDGAREMWPDEFPKDDPRPGAGERFNEVGGAPVYVEKLLDTLTGETIAEWTREQEDARLLAEEAAALAAEAVVDGGYVGPSQDVPGARGMTATGGDTEAEEAAPQVRDEGGTEPGTASADGQAPTPAPSPDESAHEFVSRAAVDVVADLPHVQSLDAARLILQAEYDRRTKQRRSVVDALLARIAVLEGSS